MKKAKAKKPSKAARYVDYHETLILRLKDHDYAVEYLNAAIREGSKGDKESQRLFLEALKNVVEAHGSISELVRRTRLCRESLYRMLSKKGNPELNSLVAI
jgi:DNA-binding phage protein